MLKDAEARTAESEGDRAGTSREVEPGAFHAPEVPRAPRRRVVDSGPPLPSSLLLLPHRCPWCGVVWLDSGVSSAHDEDARVPTAGSSGLDGPVEFGADVPSGD